MERDYWYTMARGFDGLEPADEVGRIAAQRALRRLKPVKMPTRRVPVIFDPRAARSLLDNIFEAVHGTAVYRHESFLAGRLGEKVASQDLTVVDDGTLPGLFGTSPFDDEGVASRRTVVIDRGVLKSYLLNTYAARKLGMKTTGSASRGLTGNAGIGHGNFYAERGVQTPEQLIASVSEGFYVTELIGFGVNIVAGNLKDMLLGLEAVGSDLEFRGSVAAPTLKIGEMTVGGK
jgi:PmbA protein